MNKKIRAKSTQLKFKKPHQWGGKRVGAGRKNLTKTVNHMKRPSVSAKTPLHITMILKKNLPNLRRRHFHQIFKSCVLRAKRQKLFVLHYSIQSNHIHMIVETQSNRTLQLGMRSLAGTFAKRFQERQGKSGSVFEGRYHLHVIKSTHSMRNVYRYVLFNYSRHTKLIAHIDPFSSAQNFEQPRRLLLNEWNTLISDEYENLPQPVIEVSPATSWLAREGWKHANRTQLLS